MRKLKCGIHFGDSSDEEDEGKITFIKFDPDKNDIMMLPYSVKLITPYLLSRFQDMIQFVRYDLKNYPGVTLQENAPYPYPFLEVYNMKGVLLHEVDLSCMNRYQLNDLMQEYQQLPKHSLQWLTPPRQLPICPNPDIEHQYKPGESPDAGVLSVRRFSDLSSVRTDFSLKSSEDAVVPE